MGLINLDNYVCSNGVQKTDTYISFANETLYIRQASAVDGTMTYTVSANYRIFWDEAARNSGLSFIDLKSIMTTIPQDKLPSNMYACLYEELKKIYPNTVDTALRVKADPAPVVPTPPNPASTPVTAPVVEAPVTPAPVTPAPVTPAPVVEAPAPVTPAPVVEAPAPVVEAPAPVVEAPAPVVEAPAPSEPTPSEPTPSEPAPSEPAPSV